MDDGRGRKHTTIRHPGQAEQTSQVTRFQYDAIGRRVSKQDAFGQTEFIWEGMRLIEERRGSQITSYVYEPGTYAPLARIDALGEVIHAAVDPSQGGLQSANAAAVRPAAPTPPVRPELVEGPGAITTAANDEPTRQPQHSPTVADPWGSGDNSAAQKLAQAAQIYHFHNDPSGLPEELSDDQGQVRWRAAYRTWGNTQVESWEVVRPDGSPVHPSQINPFPQGHAQKIEQNLRFQGQYLDRDTGLHYNTFRFYDPDIGRFISPDPIGLAGGTNLHSYAPNPVSWIDPWGWACGPAAKKNSRGQWIDAQGRFAKAPPKPNFTHESYLHEAGYHPNANAGGHAYGSPQTGKSKFGVNEGGSKFSNEVYNHPDVKATQQGNGRWKYEVDDMGRTTGTNTGGQPVNGGRVIVESNPSANPGTYNPGDVVTQFPT